MNKQQTERAPWHVCGLMVQCQPAQIEAVKAALHQLPDTEVAGVDEEKGRLVTVMESADQDELLARIEAARNIAGVIVVSLVYHEQDQPSGKHE